MAGAVPRVSVATSMVAGSAEPLRKMVFGSNIAASADWPLGGINRSMRFGALLRPEATSGFAPLKRSTVPFSTTSISACGTSRRRNCASGGRATRRRVAMAWVAGEPSANSRGKHSGAAFQNRMPSWLATI